MSQSHPSDPASRSVEVSMQDEFTPEERAILLRLAHEAIESALEHRELSTVASTSHLAELRGAFTTLYLAGNLRGCVGYVFPVSPLYKTIAETARAAAFDDPRFSPVTREEAKHLTISLSILSSLSTITPDEIVIGKHGLVISFGGHKGLLLPQVPVEHGWDRIIFLEHTCRKAGLPAEAWQKGATIQAFTAEVFGESEQM